MPSQLVARTEWERERAEACGAARRDTCLPRAFKLRVIEYLIEERRRRPNVMDAAVTANRDPAQLGAPPKWHISFTPKWNVLLLPNEFDGRTLYFSYSTSSLGWAEQGTKHLTWFNWTGTERSISLLPLEVASRLPLVKHEQEGAISRKTPISACLTYNSPKYLEWN